MDEGIGAAVADWDQQPLGDGLDGIRRLTEQSISGAVEIADAWLLLVDGRAVGAFTELDGPSGRAYEPIPVDRLDGTGTVYEAPDPVLPLLFAMRATGGEQRGRYYTGQRSLAAANRDLEREDFTGYLELSEEVVSGDYYLVYQDGRSMSVAFVGGERRVRTGDEAFERADQEVGIYTVTAVELPAIDLPASAPEEARADTSSAGTPTTDTRDARPAHEAAGSTTTAPDASEAVADDGQREPQDNDQVDVAVSQAEYEPATDPEPQEVGQPDRAGTTVDSSVREGHRSAEASEPSVEAFERLVGRVDDLASEQERLAATIAELRGSIEGDGPDQPTESEPAPTDRNPSATMAETTVLVRYRSDGGPRLETLGERATAREELRENLQLEVRTPFDPAETTVDGQPFPQFIEGTLEHRFVRWLVGVLPFDLREAGRVSGLDRLDAALPAIDRVTFADGASVGEERFDLVAWSREGDPLIVVRFEEGVQPPTTEATESFLQSATSATDGEPTIAAAVLVTTAYVDGESLDVAREATRSSLLDRSRRESYVRTSDGGYHLCLVEAGDSFHLAVPEL